MNYRNLASEEVEVMGRKIPKSEADNMTAEMILIDISSGLKRLNKLGVDQKIINDTLINSLNYTELNYLCSDIDSFLRAYKF